MQISPCVGHPAFSAERRCSVLSAYFTKMQRSILSPSNGSKWKRDGPVNCRIERFTRSLYLLSMLGFPGNPLETQVYSDCRIFLRSSDPVIISGATGGKTSKFLGCRWLKCACHRPSSLSKELLQPFGRDDEENRRLIGDIADISQDTFRFSLR